VKRTIVQALIIVLLVACIGYGIQLLDFSPVSIQWMPPQPPNLDAGYTVRSSATSFTVSSTDPWDVAISGAGWTRDGLSSDKPVSDFEWKSYCTTQGTMTTVTTYHDTWQPLSTQTQSVASGSAGENAQFLMDYRIKLDWHDQPGTYAITLTYDGTGGTPDTKTQDITLIVPATQRLDMTGSFAWVEVTAADLGRAYLVRSASTSLVVSSNEDWETTVSVPSGWDSAPPGANITLGDFKWKSHCVTSGTMASTVTTPDTWTSLTTGSVVVVSGSPGKDGQFLMDYRIDFDWKDPPGDYQITPTYQLGDESKDVAVTITNPTIQSLDLTADQIQWVKVTAADLDRGYVLSSAATSFVVGSNIGWEVIVATSGDEVSGGVHYFTATLGNGQYGLPVTDLYWKSHVVDKGSLDTAPTVQEAEWVTFDAATGACASKVATTTEAGTDCVVMADYKIALNWHDSPDTYSITLTYTLQPSS